MKNSNISVSPFPGFDLSIYAKNGPSLEAIPLNDFFYKFFILIPGPEALQQLGTPIVVSYVRNLLPYWTSLGNT
jgi:hypothetical protein